MEPIKDIKGHPLLKQLTSNQRMFVLHYIDTQDKIKAITESGYNCRDDITKEMLARKNLKHPIIKQLIGEALGYAPTGGCLSKEEACVLISEHIRNTKLAYLAFKYIALLAEIRGWRDKEFNQHIMANIKRFENNRIGKKTRASKKTRLSPGGGYI